MVKLYRAQPITGISPRTAPTFLDNIYGGVNRGIGGTSLQGQFYTTDPARARAYMPTSFQKFSYFDPKLGPKFMGFGNPVGAFDPSKSITTKPGIIKSMDLSDLDFEKVKSFTKKVPTLQGYQFATNLPNEYLVPKTFLQNRNPSINLGQTLRAYGDVGLNFLKNRALQTLGLLGTLPAQAGIMTLTPTIANAGEAGMTVNDFAALRASENQEARRVNQYRNDGGGGGGGNISASQAASNREGRRGGQYGFAKGGLIDEGVSTLFMEK
jgi:hypothetical protein